MAREDKKLDNGLSSPGVGSAKQALRTLLKELRRNIGYRIINLLNNDMTGDVKRLRPQEPLSVARRRVPRAISARKRRRENKAGSL
jgi:hypothetical protein